MNALELITATVEPGNHGVSQNSLAAVCTKLGMRVTSRRGRVDAYRRIAPSLDWEGIASVFNDSNYGCSILCLGYATQLGVMKLSDIIRGLKKLRAAQPHVLDLEPDAGADYLIREFGMHQVTKSALVRDLAAIKSYGARGAVTATVEHQNLVDTAAPWSFPDGSEIRVKARHPNLHNLTATFYSYAPHHPKADVVFESEGRIREIVNCRENHAVEAMDRHYKLGLSGRTTPEKYVQQLWYILCKASVDKLGGMLKPGSNFMRIASPESLGRVRSNYESFKAESQ